jgi:cytochrome b involved in lipid metabolism
MTAADKLYGWDEIMKHTTERSCWIVLNGNVVDVTDWLPLHPGGVDTIAEMGGRDVTNMFQAVSAHGRSARADTEWKRRVIGKVDPTSVRPPPKAAGPRRDVKPIRYGLGVSPTVFWALVLAAIIAVIALAIYLQ